MKKSAYVKPWRANVLVLYHDPTYAGAYRFHILQALTSIASIYKLDYAVEQERQFPSFGDSTTPLPDKNIADLVYFRSNQLSRIARKDFRRAIDGMFGTVPSLFVEGVEICTQLYKLLPRFPFPDEFYRPLNYPYVEFHKGGQTVLYIYSDRLLTEIEREQDFPLN